MLIQDEERGDGKVINASAFTSDKCVEVSYNAGNENSGAVPEMHAKFLNGERVFYSGEAATRTWQAILEIVNAGVENKETDDASEQAPTKSKSASSGSGS